MSLVHASTSRLCGRRVLELILLGRRWVPEPGIVRRRDRKILGDILDPGWEPIDPLPRGKHECDLRRRVSRGSTEFEQCGGDIRYAYGSPYLDLGVVRNGSLTIRSCRQGNLEDAELGFGHGM